MDNPVTITLSDGLSVLCSGCDHALAEAFRTHFDSVWRQLPQIVRSVCLQHWKRRQSSPSIQFHSFSAYRNEVSGGNVRDDGNDIRYNSDIFGFMPSPLRNAVIAHELGHVYFIGLREPIHITATRYLPPSYQDVLSCEFITRHMNQLWGFDQPGIDEWLERELCPGIPYLRSTAGEAPMSEEEYNGIVEKQLLKWGSYYSCDSLESAQRERDRLLRDKAIYFEMGQLSDSDFATYATTSIDAIEKVVQGVHSLDDLKMNPARIIYDASP